MATTLLSTPSPDSPSRICTPPTPRFGILEDHWEPFTPRKSARLSSQRVAEQTPSSKVPTRHSQSSHFRTPKVDTRKENIAMIPQTTASQKKRQPPSETGLVSGPLTEESINIAAAALGQTEVTDAVFTRPNNATTGLLPTPAKTPSRKHSEQKASQIKSVARNLFGREELKTKRTKKYTSLTMNSFEAEQEEEETIQIFTDSHERIPEPVASNNNPFHREAKNAAATKAANASVPARRSTRQRTTVSIPGEDDQTVEEVMRRDDGILYVFRGKKVFKKFTAPAEGMQEDSEDSEVERELENEVPSSAGRRPLTRSHLKPKLLFPSKAPKTSKTIAINEDEEADTEIEDHASASAGEEQPETPFEQVDDKEPATPSAPKFAPASPPATARAIRSVNKDADELAPVKPSLKGKGKGKRSPFDAWRRTKKGGEGAGQKRSGGPLNADSAAKRPRA